MDGKEGEAWGVDAAPGIKRGARALVRELCYASESSGPDGGCL